MSATSADATLARLRDPDDPVLAELAALVVSDLTSRPLRSLATAGWLASQLVAALEAAVRADRVREQVDRVLARALEQARGDDRSLRDRLPAEVVNGLVEVAGRPFSPEPELLERLVDQPAVRRLLRFVLEDTIRRVARNIGRVDDALGGLGQRAARRGRALGRSLLGDVAKVASDLARTVEKEVEGAFEARLRDLADEATRRAVQLLVQKLADPDDPETFAALRQSVLDVVLDTPVRDLAAEIDKLDPEELTQVIVRTLRRGLEREGIVDELAGRIEQLLDEAGDGTLDAWLREVELHDVWTRTTHQLVTERLRDLVAEPAFEAWWRRLHGG